MKPLITDIPIGKLPTVVSELGLKKYTVSQIISWLYKGRVDSFDLMTNLSKDARSLLAERYEIDAVKFGSAIESSDGTKKYLCQMRDGHAVECVFIPSEDGRGTVCISTQAGCAMGCAFCRTAQMGLVRNLSQGEILGQLITVMRDSGNQVTNVVLMGMGEPLANLDEVANAVRIMFDTRAFGFSKRRITLSTCGLLPQIEKFTAQFGIKIAISLNAADDETRSRLMPINKRCGISELMAFCKKYSAHSRHRVTFEYVLIRGVNDGMQDAERLVNLLKGVRAKINLIPFNPFEGAKFKAPQGQTVKHWQDELAKAGIQANIRVSRGQDILAACGQLAAVALGKVPNPLLFNMFLLALGEAGVIGGRAF